jgi:clan AA aspartic protease (TIGR02281 family)
VLSNGQTVMRENQYDIADKGDGVGWTGWRSGKQMRASIEHYNGRLIYAEAVYAGGEKLVGSNYIDCGPAPADEPDYTPAQTPAQAYVATPPAQAYVAATPAPTYAPALDRLPVMISHNQAHAAVSLGTLPVIMLIDTGCTNMSVSQSIAERLLTSGQAMRGEEVEATLADGSTHTEASIVINSMTVGGHVLSDVPASVSPNGAEMLLGFNVLNRVSGKFAINVNPTLDFE